MTAAVVSDFNSQYPPLRIKSNKECHDRWIVLDYGLTEEEVYHCGASSKDAGKKLCAINKIENTDNYKLKGSKDIKNRCRVMEEI